jgi:hypothetical protein
MLAVRHSDTVRRSIVMRGSGLSAKPKWRSIILGPVLRPAAIRRMSEKMQLTREKPARIGCRPIRDADIGPLIELLTEGFPDRTAANWARAMQRLARREVPAPYPRFGYLLEVDDTPVGVVLLIFSTQGKERGSHVRCNISSWYVKDSYRGYASLLSNAAVRHKQVTYINISPGVWTWPIIEAQGFTRYTLWTDCSGSRLQPMGRELLRPPVPRRRRLRPDSQQGGARHTDCAPRLRLSDVCRYGEGRGQSLHFSSAPHKP